jgi:hypothetical protein
LKTVAHLSNPNIRSILESYQIGKIQRPGFASVDPEDAYDAAVELGEKSSEIENIYRTTFQFLNGKLTALDKLNVLTAQKAGHLRESQCQLHDEHAPLLATLLDTVLAAVLRLDPQRERDLNPLRARVASIASKTILQQLPPACSDKLSSFERLLAWYSRIRIASQ